MSVSGCREQTSPSGRVSGCWRVSGRSHEVDSRGSIPAPDELNLTTTSLPLLRGAVHVIPSVGWYNLPTGPCSTCDTGGDQTQRGSLTVVDILINGCAHLPTLSGFHPGADFAVCGLQHNIAFMCNSWLKLLHQCWGTCTSQGPRKTTGGYTNVNQRGLCSYR